MRASLERCVPQFMDFRHDKTYVGDCIRPASRNWTTAGLQTTAGRRRIRAGGPQREVQAQPQAALRQFCLPSWGRLAACAGLAGPLFGYLRSSRTGQEVCPTVFFHCSRPRVRWSRRSNPFHGYYREHLARDRWCLHKRFSRPPRRQR